MKRNMQDAIRKIVLLVTSYSLLVTSLGCEAFVRKFTRKPKHQEDLKEEMVLAPEEYTGPQMSKEELYRQYLLFWGSWHDELIKALAPNANHKKQLDCAAQTINNLMNLRGLLNEDRQKKLDTYIVRLVELRENIAKDVYGNNASFNRHSAEILKRSILRDFSYDKVRDYFL